MGNSGNKMRNRDSFKMLKFFLKFFYEESRFRKDVCPIHKFISQISPTRSQARPLDILICIPEDFM